MIAVFDFGREHVEAAGDHHVLLAVDDVEVAVGVAIGDVAGMVPAVACDFRGGVRLLEIGVGDQSEPRTTISPDLPGGRRLPSSSMMPTRTG